MTYQAFPNISLFNIIDPGSNRDFKIKIPKDKYITQDDIYFNIKYTNINYDKIEKIYDDYLTKSKSLGFDKYKSETLKEYKNKMNELIDLTMKEIEEEETKAKDRQTPLFMFQDIELFVICGDEREKSIARRMFSGLDEMIENEKLSVNQIFPGIKFKYTFGDTLTFRFTRSIINNKCLNFECHYNLHETKEEDITFGLFTGFKEFIIPSGFYTGFIDIEPDVKSFKMIPCVNHHLRKKLEHEDYVAEAQRLIKENYDILKLKYYKDGLEVSESEFGNSPGIYHIKLLNENEIKNIDDFHSVDYRILCWY